MSDTRYAAYPQYAQSYPYATALPQGQRTSSGQGHYHHAREGPTTHVSSYSPYPSSYPSIPSRTDPSALHGGHGYPQDSARHRTSSLHSSQPSPIYNTNPPMLQTGHPRAHPQQHQHHYGSPTDAVAHAGATYMAAQPHELQADYLRSGTVTPEYYYAQAAHENPSPPRPFPCDLCALSFNRAHDLKRHRDTHSGERPFLCNGGCGKTFTRKDALKRHQLVKSCGRADE